MFLSFLDQLKGWKTYGVAAMVVAIGVGEGLLGWDIPGVDASDWVAYILSGLGLSALRAGVAKV